MYVIANHDGPYVTPNHDVGDEAPGENHILRTKIILIQLEKVLITEYEP